MPLIERVKEEKESENIEKIGKIMREQFNALIP
jgi:hypothetical protein